MVELKIYLSESLNERFRKTAMNVYGYGRGSLSKAAEEALTKWCTDHSEPLAQPVSSGGPNERGEKEQSGINPDERQSDAERSAAADEGPLSKSITEDHPIGNGAYAANS